MCKEPSPPCSRSNDSTVHHGSNLSRLMHSALLHGDELSRMFFVLTSSCNPTCDEAWSTVIMGNRMRNRGEYLTAIVIQKSIRAYFARRWANLLGEAREKKRARQRRILDLQRRFPAETRTKDEWRALLIGIGKCVMSAEWVAHLK